MAINVNALTYIKGEEMCLPQSCVHSYPNPPTEHSAKSTVGIQEIIT